MQFIAVAMVAVVAVFTGFFTLSNVQTSLQELSQHRLEREALKASAEGVVNGKYIEVFPNVGYPGATVLSVLNEVPQASSFRKIFMSVNGGAYFKSGVSYTLFVPTDAAFEKLSNPARIQLSSMTQEEKERLVAHHIIPEKMIAVGIQKAGYAWTLSGDALNFELRKDGGVVGNAHVQAVYVVDNGIVYFIDQILFPPDMRFVL